MSDDGGQALRREASALRALTTDTPEIALHCEAHRRYPIPLASSAADIHFLHEPACLADIWNWRCIKTQHRHLDRPLGPLPQREMGMFCGRWSKMPKGT